MTDKLKPLRARLRKLDTEPLIRRCEFLLNRIKMDQREIDAIRKELERRENVESR